MQVADGDVEVFDKTRKTDVVRVQIGIYWTENRNCDVFNIYKCLWLRARKEVRKKKKYPMYSWVTVSTLNSQDVIISWSFTSAGTIRAKRWRIVSSSGNLPYHRTRGCRPSGRQHDAYTDIAIDELFQRQQAEADAWWRKGTLKEKGGMKSTKETEGARDTSGWWKRLVPF